MSYIKEETKIDTKETGRYTKCQEKRQNEFEKKRQRGKHKGKSKKKKQN